MKKLEIIQNIPSPYRLTMFSEMYRQCKERGVEFHVNIMCKGHADRPLWMDPEMDFPHTYWNDYGYSHHHFNPGMISYVRKVRPDALLVGTPFDTFTGIAAAFFCPAGHRACWVEGQTKTPGKMTGFIGWFKRFVCSQFEMVAVPGSDGCKYFELHQRHTSRKMPRCILLPNLVDEKRFRLRSGWDPAVIKAIRDKIGVKADEKLCFISARLDPVKGLPEFIENLDAEMLKGWKIAIFGQGSQAELIPQIIHKRGLEEFFYISSYISYDEMPAHYAAGDLFLLPSLHDPNPLSVAEALHSGLPIALSDRAGNVEEGVTDGENGWRLPVLDKTAYAAKLKDVFASDLTRLRKMGEISKTVNAKFWDSERAVAHFLDEMLADDKKGE